MTSHELQVWMEDRLNELRDNQVQIRITLAEQAKDIKHHIKRCDLLEDRVEQFQKFLNGLLGIAKALGYAALILGIIASAMKLFG